MNTFKANLSRFIFERVRVGIQLGNEYIHGVITACTLHCQINGGGDASRFLTFFPPEDAY